MDAVLQRGFSDAESVNKPGVQKTFVQFTAMVYLTCLRLTGYFLYICHDYENNSFSQKYIL
jgi:hypothetical protein